MQISNQEKNQRINDVTYRGVVVKVNLKKSKFGSFLHFLELNTCVNLSKHGCENFSASLRKKDHFKRIKNKVSKYQIF